MRVSRRRFLRSCAVAGAGAALGGVAVGGRPRPASAAQRTPGGGSGPFGILEIFVHGAFSHRETLWVESAPQASQTAWAPISRSGGVPGLSQSLAQSLASGTGNPPLSASEWAQFHPFHTDTHQVDVFMGPCASPIVGTPLFERARMVALGHVLPAHEAAAHVALTGVSPGRLYGAGLGASMAWARPGARTYVVAPVSVPQPVVQSALATGQLGAGFTPTLIPVGADGFAEQLDRGWVAPGDDLLRHYRDRYAARLVHPASQGRVRSAGFDAYSSSVDQLLSADAISAAIGGHPLSGSNASWSSNHGTLAIRTAARLIAGGADYAGAILRGCRTPVDTHSGTPQNHFVAQTGNLWSVFRALRDALDAGELDLDRTLVVLHSEFGRGPDPDGQGTAHYTLGYPVLLIGGPVAARGIGRTIEFGTASPDGTAQEGAGGRPLGPGELRIALLGVAGASTSDLQDGPIRPDDTTTPEADHTTLRISASQVFLGGALSSTTHTPTLGG